MSTMYLKASGKISGSVNFPIAHCSRGANVSELRLKEGGKPHERIP